MFDAAVEVGIAAFLAGQEPPSDDDIRADLRHGGVEPWLAERLILFLPLAFGRRLLPGVQLSGDFLDGPQPSTLTGDAVFRAASVRAQRANRAEVERIGLRSSEVDAVNNALNAGSRLEDLVLGPAALPEPLPAAGTGDGGVPSPREAFAAFLAGHGFSVDDGSRIGDFEFDARVFVHASPGSAHVMLQVDFAVRHPALAQEWMLESFAGYGGTWREAVNRAIAMFERASLHPIIAALLDRGACQDQVSWEPYPHPAGTFQLCVGPQITMFSPEPAPPAGPLLDSLLDSLRRVPLSGAVHWLRVFTSHRDGQPQTNEVLLDGEPWADGEQAVAASPAPHPNGMVGLRIFAILLPE
ncbi:MAG TPA: DUF6348 family protein [Candidatus Limnocylindrales bacterium]